jgi:hypothetical protein
MRRVFFRDHGKRVLPTHQGARVEIVLAGPLAQFIEKYAALGVTWKDERLARVEK